MWTDLRYALRTLRRSPVFTAVAVVSLALGIGVNTCIFSLLDQALLRSLPVADPDRMVVLHASEGHFPGWATADNSETVLSYPLYRDLRDRNRILEGVIARSGASVSLSAGGQTERAQAEIVSGNFFGVLGVRAAIGRTLTPEDDTTPGAHPVVVLGNGYWVRRFGSNPGVLNQTVLLNGHPMTVVGVAARGFRSVLSGQTPDLFVPIAMKRQVTPTWDGLDDRGIFWLSVFARLKPGMAAKQAEAGIAPVWRGLMDESLAAVRNPPPRTRSLFGRQKLQLKPASQGINQLGADWRTPLIALAGMVGLVLLIACANIANLLIARATGRRKEIAVRLALGAGRGAIVRQVMSEALVLALTGGGAGLLLARWTGAALLQLLPSDATGDWLSPAVDSRMLLFTFALAVATGLLFGLAPAMQSARQDLAPVLKDQGAGSGAGGGAARFRRILVAAQITLSLFLLVGAGLFARSLRNLMSDDPGFRIDHLIAFAVDPSLSGYDTGRGVSFYSELDRRLAALGGVKSVGSANIRPMTSSSRSGNITVEGYRTQDSDGVPAAFNIVGPGYFRTLGTALIAGREFTGRDDAAAPKVAIVNQEFVKAYFRGESPIGKRVATGSGPKVVPNIEIVGVVANARQSLRTPVRRMLFFPYAQQERLERLSFLVRTDREEASIAPEIRRLVASMDRNMPVFEMKTMRAELNDSIYADRLIALLSAAFGLLATVLAAVGLYGVIAYSVARRTTEMGLRIALGADPLQVLWLVLREVVLLLAAGFAVGVPAALALGRLVESQLFGLKANDPAILAGACLALAAVALAAGYVPARRATRVDPIRALRYE